MPKPKNSGSSRISGSVSSFVNDRGAGAHAGVTATTPDGETITSSDEVFTPEATSSSASIEGSASSSNPPRTSIMVSVSAADELNQESFPILTL